MSRPCSKVLEISTPTSAFCVSYNAFDRAWSCYLYTSPLSNKAARGISRESEVVQHSSGGDVGAYARGKLRAFRGGCIAPAVLSIWLVRVYVHLSCLCCTIFFFWLSYKQVFLHDGLFVSHDECVQGNIAPSATTSNVLPHMRRGSRFQPDADVDALRVRGIAVALSCCRCHRLSHIAIASLGSRTRRPPFSRWVVTAPARWICSDMYQ